jgi:hypothetical protein
MFIRSQENPDRGRKLQNDHWIEVSCFYEYKRGERGQEGVNGPGSH